MFYRLGTRMDRRSAVRRRVTAALSSFSPSVPFCFLSTTNPNSTTTYSRQWWQRECVQCFGKCSIGTDRELILRGSSCVVVLLRIHPLSHRYFPFVSYQLPLQAALLGSIDDGDERKRVQCQGRCFIGLERERFRGASRVVVLLRICFPFLTFISF
jgi:hypothetical protein